MAGKSNNYFKGHLEDIFVPDLNNPDVSLNAFQVLITFQITKSNITIKSTITMIKTSKWQTGNKKLDGRLRSICDGGCPH